MKVALITPAAKNSRSGNRNTAARWARMLREIGHAVSVQVSWSGRRCDAMLALHARKSRDSIVRFTATQPDSPLIVALTGTDLYRDIREDAAARDSLALAHRLVVLQDEALSELTADERKKARVIYQSVGKIPRGKSYKKHFEVCVLGHLREEKDPFRCALALEHLPEQSRIRVTQLGRALDKTMKAQARKFERRQPRYRWLEEVSHGRALTRLARSQLMVISSRMEGGANVVSEAIAAGVPVIASRISGNIGMLGRDYAGYYSLGDERALAKQLWRAESEPAFYRLLRSQVRTRLPLVSPRRETAALKALLLECVKESKSERVKE